jgi:predicted CXXCH cytochrome family protein
MRKTLPYLAVCATLVAIVPLTPRSTLAQQSKAEWKVSAFAKYTSIAGAKRVGSEACAACHADVSKDFQHAFHAQQGVECEDCHGAGSLHVAGDISKIINYKKLDARDANGACLSCHGQDEKVRNWMTGPHADNGVRCTDCHQVHQSQGKTERLSFDTSTLGRTSAVEEMVPEAKVMMESPEEQNENCLRCHQEQRAQMSMPYHHPLREGKMSCVDCHDPHGGSDGRNLRVSNVNELCLGCHAQYRGPFAYQHPPVSENCLLCHTPHGSPNTNLLSVSEPALCLQCHAGHHNGASLPLTDRCTDCHGSIHGTDTPTPTGGSRFVDKGPSEPALLAAAGQSPSFLRAHGAGSASAMASAVSAGMPPLASGAAGVSPLSPSALAGGGLFASMLSQELRTVSGGNMLQGVPNPAEAQPAGAFAAYSITPGAYRFVDLTGFGGRVGEYNSLDQSAEADIETAFVSLPNHTVIVSRGTALSGEDFQAASQVTIGEWAQLGMDIRSFVQQQDHYPFYAFPVLDVPPGTTTPLDTTTDSIPPNALFNVKRRMGSAYARVKVPRLPVHVFVNGDWQSRVGETQLAYLDENSFVTTPGFTQSCGAQCHFNSQFQPVNYTTRNIGGGADVKLGHFVVTWMHTFSSFNDRLMFPTGTFTGEFDVFPDAVEAFPFGFAPSSAGPSANLPPSGPAPVPVPASPTGTGYSIDIPSPSQSSTDSVSMNWTPSSRFTFNGNVSYTRLRDMYTQYPQNSFNSDETVNYHPFNRLRLTADYHQQNLINDFTPFYSLYGNVSYHQHWEGLKAEYELSKGVDAEAYYKRSGVGRADAALWNDTAYNLLGSQIYSVDNTDLLKVVPSSTSNTGGLALHYHDAGWSARAGYEWTGTNNPGYLIVPQSNNRTFADVWFTPTARIVFSNDLSIIVQNDFPAVPLINTPGTTPLSAPGATSSFGLNISGLPPTFQRRDRFYNETASADFIVIPDWRLGLGYSYQQNNLLAFMAFQNDSATGYILDEPNVPYKQITQAYWGDSNYAIGKRAGLNFRVTYNSARSGFRPDLNPADAAALGNQYLISQATFNPAMFAAALNNIQFASTQISEVIVPQWIGESKGYYLFPHGFNGGLTFYYGSYRDYWNPNLNGVLRTFSIYIGRSW